MKRFAWPRVMEAAVAIPPVDPPHMARTANQILDHARAAAFHRRSFVEAKYQRDCCSLLLWRLSVDGLTADGQLKMDGAKWETRIPGRLSSSAARAIREAPDLRGRSQSALGNGKRVAPDHIVPRNCVSEVLIRPDWLDLEDVSLFRSFLISHAEIAVLSPEEDQNLKDNDLESKMPAVWWDAAIERKVFHRFARYEALGIKVDPWPSPCAAP